MGRKTFFKVITTPELIEKINPENKKLVAKFLKEKSTRSSELTVMNYQSDLNIFFVYNLLNNDNKFFVDIKTKSTMWLFEKDEKFLKEYSAWKKISRII